MKSSKGKSQRNLDDLNTKSNQTVRMRSERTNENSGAARFITNEKHNSAALSCQSAFQCGGGTVWACSASILFPTVSLIEESIFLSSPVVTASIMVGHIPSSLSMMLLMMRLDVVENWDLNRFEQSGSLVSNTSTGQTKQMLVPFPLKGCCLFD